MHSLVFMLEYQHPFYLILKLSTTSFILRNMWKASGKDNIRLEVTTLSNGFLLSQFEHWAKASQFSGALYHFRTRNIVPSFNIWNNRQLWSWFLLPDSLKRWKESEMYLLWSTLDTTLSLLMAIPVIQTTGAFSIDLKIKIF